MRRAWFGVVLLLGVWGWASPRAVAQTYTWNGTAQTGGTAAEWLLATNWTPTGIPGISGANAPPLTNNDIAVFGGTNYANVGVSVGVGVDTHTLGEIRVLGSNALVLGNSNPVSGLGVKYLTLRGGDTDGLSRVILAAVGGDITVQNRIGTGAADAPLVLRLANQDGTSIIRADAGRTITLNSGVADIGPFTGGTSYGMLKRGAGTLVLNGPGTYTGTTIVGGGTLLVNNTTGSGSGPALVTVSFEGGLRGTLGGTGSISGGVLVRREGAEFGTLTAGTAADRTLNTGAIDLQGNYRVRLFGTAAEQSSRVDSSGVVALNSSLARIELDLGAETVAGIRTGGAKSYTVLTGVGGGGNGVTGVFFNAPVSGPLDFSSLGFTPTEWAIQYNASNVVLTFTPVPEPAAVLGIAAAGLALARLVRRGSPRPSA